MEFVVHNEFITLIIRCVRVRRPPPFSRIPMHGLPAMLADSELIALLLVFSSTVLCGAGRCLSSQLSYDFGSILRTSYAMTLLGLPAVPFRVLFRAVFRFDETGRVTKSQSRPYGGKQEIRNCYTALFGPSPSSVTYVER